MGDFKKTLNNEATEVRGLIERHVKQQMGLLKPTTESEAQTMTYRRLKDEIVDQARQDIEKTERNRAEEHAAFKTNRLEKDIVEHQQKI